MPGRQLPYPVPRYRHCHQVACRIPLELLQRGQALAKPCHARQVLVLLCLPQDQRAAGSLHQQLYCSSNGLTATVPVDQCAASRNAALLQPQPMPPPMLPPVQWVLQSSLPCADAPCLLACLHA